MYDKKLEALIEHWKKFRVSSSEPHIHPADRNLLLKLNSHFFQDYNQYIDSYLAGCVSPTDIHTGLLPVPFWGDFRTAKVFILMINPGFSHDDYVSEVNEEFRVALENNLHSWNFSFLDKKFLWTGGGWYWEGRFKEIAEELRMKKYCKNYGDALQHIAKRVSVIELVPYHSKKFRVKGSILNQLESKRIAHEAANAIAKVAKRNEAGLIIRGNRYWQIHEGSQSIEVIRSVGMNFPKGSKAWNILWRFLTS
ncbi:MAG: hypothetical protein PHZ00_07395 [Candidatus Peribacteraceae bacterium]|nr:hypothetical protein [Candidatus Peribacteraceae bacterium]